MCEHYLIKREDDNFYGFEERQILPLNEAQVNCFLKFEEGQKRKVRLYKLIEVKNED